MKVVFNGMIEKKSGGCGSCGKRRTENQFVAYRTFILPSGIIKTFRAGVPETVSPEDANFLLMYRYQDANGVVKNAFEVVE